MPWLDLEASDQYDQLAEPAWRFHSEEADTVTSWQISTEYSYEVKFKYIVKYNHMIYFHNDFTPRFDQMALNTPPLATLLFAKLRPDCCHREMHFPPPLRSEPPPSPLSRRPRRSLRWRELKLRDRHRWNGFTAHIKPRGT